MFANTYPARCTKCRGPIPVGDGVRDGRDARGKATYRHRGEYDGRRCATREVIRRKLRPVA